MDEQDPRLEGERLTYRTVDPPVGRTSEAIDVTRSVQAPDLPATRISESAGTVPSSRGVDTADTADDDGDNRRLRRLQEEVVEARGEIATTLGAIEDRLRPSTLAANAAEAVTDKAASIGDSIAASQPARYARANPWGTALALAGAAVAVWLIAAPRRRRRRMPRRSRRAPGGINEFTRTHYDAGVEHGLEAAATRVHRASPTAPAGVTYTPTEERQHDAYR